MTGCPPLLPIAKHQWGESGMMSQNNLLGFFFKLVFYFHIIKIQIINHNFNFKPKIIIIIFLKI